MGQKPIDLRTFFKDFADEHTLSDGDELLLDVAPQELEELGAFFLRGVCAMALKLDARHLRPNHSALPTTDDADVDVGVLEEVIPDETDYSH